MFNIIIIITLYYIMKIILVYIIINISLSLNLELIDAIYHLIFNNLYLTCLNKIIRFEKSHIGSFNSSFRIKKYSYNLKTSFYYIEYLETKNKISVSKKKKDSNLKQNNDIHNMYLWSFIKIKNNNYIIQNEKKCYLIVKDLSIKCEYISMEKASQFKLIKLYEEVTEKELNNELIEKEPIDVLIKYIDLRDPLLNRGGIHQIKKDYDNEELRFSVRSILKNIPWIRKIFILMPNNKVRYFKNYKLIKEKIVYVKDKDLLGFDSSSSITFQFNYWKMKKFGISNNFIIMDDDYFIGHPMKKSDFFYNKNNKIVPIIITNRFKYITKKKIDQQLSIIKEKLKKAKKEQIFVHFQYSKYLTYLFIEKIFKKSLFVPKFTHNAIPVNLDEIKEIYNLVFNSPYKSTTLFSTYRHLESLQFQTFFLSYTFLKYNRKVKYISYKYISNKKSFLANYNYDLFCINTNGYHNSNLSFLKTRLIMEYLFPEITPYEIIDYYKMIFLFKFLRTTMNKEYKMNKYNKEYKYRFLIIEKNIKKYRKVISNFILNITFIIIILLCKKYKFIHIF